jgi:glycosyltransferase involved in cell wall biosynthesis
MVTPLRICYLTFDGLNEGVGQSQIVPLVKKLALLGHKVTIISFEKDNSLGVIKDLEVSNINWLTFPFGRQGFKGIPKRIFLMAKNLPKADVYHSRSDLPVLALALRRRKPFLWDARSLWYEQKLIIESRPRSGIFFALARKLEKYAASHASAINVLAEPLLQVIDQRNGGLPKLQSVIPTTVDLEKFAKREPRNASKMVLLSGTLNNFYDIETTRAILSAFHQKGFKIEWARGAESSRKDLEDSLLITSVLKHEEMPSKIAECSLGLAICRTDCSEVLKGVMPTKVAEFLSVGRPVIVSQGMGDLDNLIRNSNTGIVITEEMSINEIVENTLNLLKDPELSTRCRELAENHFSMEEAVLKYCNTYELMNNHK